jgi:hypothetical protein
MEFVLVNSVCVLLDCTYRTIRRIAGKPDAIIRRGTCDLPAWRYSRIDSIRNAWSFPFPAPDNPTEFYTLMEAARAVGVTYPIARRILKSSAVLVCGDREDSLFTESEIMRIRVGIKDGSIRVQTRSLTKPKLGVWLDEPRHTLCDQTLENERIRKARPFAGLVY